jgi:hypothetical protein
MVATSKVSMIFACVPLSLVFPHFVDISVLVVRALPYSQTVMLTVLLGTVCSISLYPEIRLTPR